MKKILIYGAIAAAGSLAALFAAGRAFPDNIAETAPDGGAKNLKTRVYQTDLATAEKTVKEIIPTLSTYGGSWKVVGESSDSVKGKIIKAEIPVVVFTDDLEVFIKESGDVVTIDAKSNSRVGKSDFGENARHVRQFLEALDAKFPK